MLSDWRRRKAERRARHETRVRQKWAQWHTDKEKRIINGFRRWGDRNSIDSNDGFDAINLFEIAQKETSEPIQLCIATGGKVIIHDAGLYWVWVQPSQNK